MPTRSTYSALLGAGFLACALVDAPTAQAACVGGPVVFNCSGADAAGTIVNVGGPVAPTYHLIGEVITGPGGAGVNIQPADPNPANTAAVTMDAASSITLSGINLNRGLWLETNGPGISVNVAGPITTVGGNSIFATNDSAASAAPVSITTLAGGVTTGRITGGTMGSGGVTITTGAAANFVVGSGGVTEGSSAIDASSFGGGHVTVQVNAAVTSFFDGVQGITSLGGQVDITTGAGGSVNAGRIGIIAEAELGNAAVNVTTNAPVLTTGAFGTPPFGIFAMSDGGNVTVTNNATVGNFGIRAFSGVGAFTTGNVTVDANASVTGNGTLGAINASTSDGLVTINVNNGATIAATNAAADAIHLQTTGLGGVAITLAAGTTVNGAGGGIFVDQSTGSGSTMITNNGTVIGAGSPTKPVIFFSTNGTATLNNNGSISSTTGSPASLAFAKIGGGATTINNAGSIVGRVAGLNMTFNNSNSWTVFAVDVVGNNATINNSGTIFVAGTAGNSGSITTIETAGRLTVSNTGSVVVNGAAQFLGSTTLGSTFANAGGIIDMRQGVVGDIATIGFNFNGGANSRLGVDTFLGGAGSKSDQLLISGNVTGNTSIIVRDTNPGPGGFTGPGGIPIVTVAGASNPGNFSLSPASTVIGGSFLPINGGVLRKGLFDYTLVDDPSVFALVSVPNTALFQMPVAITAAQNIWYETAFGWEDRQIELRDYFHRGEVPIRNPGGMPVKAYGPAPAAPPMQPGVWLKAVGSWTDRSDTQNFAIAGTSLPVDLGYKQNVYGLIGGIDAGRDGVLSRNDAIAVSLMGGYVNSNINFNTNPATFGYSGGTAGASATYMNNRFFADTLVKADFLRLNVGGLPAEAGTPGTTVNTLTFGAMGNAGFHIERDRVFLEPLATLAYTRTRIDSIALPAAGVAVDFNDAETFRAALGARIGGRLVESAGYGLDASVVARVWDQFRGNSAAKIVNFGLPLTLTDSFTGAFGEVTGHLDFIARGTGLSAFVAGGVKFNHDFTTTSAKGGIRYQF